MSRTHCLKTWPSELEAIHDGRKRFEWRKDDRDFVVGDKLSLEEWEPTTNCYSCVAWPSQPHFVVVVVTYILRGQFGVPPGFVVLGISAPLEENRCPRWKAEPR